jgi:hypothetical protein
MRMKIAAAALAVFTATILHAAAIDDDTRNMDLGTFADQQKPARLKISSPSGEASTEESSAASRRPTQQATKAAAEMKARRKALEEDQLNAQRALRAAVAAKDFKRIEGAAMELERANARLRALQ